jgi:nucleoside phosphorylase
MRLFVAADPREFTGFLKRCSNLRQEHLAVHWATSGTFQGKPMLAVANGMGFHRAYAAVTGKSLEMVCNIGFCGALDPSLRVADVFVATHVNGLPIRQPRSNLAVASGPLASIEHIARTAAEKRELHLTGAMAVEMEAAGALKHARTLGVPFFAVRVVSDLAKESLHCDFQRAVRDDGTIDIVRLAVQAVTRPFTCGPELIRLGRRAVLASERLGEFLASCEF